MFLNFTEETCTGTAAVLTLAGATADNNAFGKTGNGVDGAVYACVVEDGDGVKKVAGIYTFDKTANTLTRDDTWNDNGTTIDNNPATNIALSAGTHTVRCDVVGSELIGLAGYSKSMTASRVMNGIHGNNSTGTGASFGADKQWAVAFLLKEASLIQSLAINCYNVADAAGLAAIGLSRLVDGLSDSTYLANGSIDITTTGTKTLTINKILQPGWYMCHLVTNSATVNFEQLGGTSLGWSPLRESLYNNRNATSAKLTKSGVTGGVLTADPSTVISQTVGGDSAPLFWMQR